MSAAPYFSNHDRRKRFPWSLYHRELEQRVEAVVHAHGAAARVLVVGCGLEPRVAGVPIETSFACDLDAAAIAACSERWPELATHLARCPSEYELPSLDGAPFDVVVAKEVIEHVGDPPRWARALSSRIARGGSLVLTTPSYGSLSTLALLEATVLELVARREGWSRAHIHPSRFDRRRLATLDVGVGMRLVSVTVTRTGWALVGHWRRAS